MNNVLPRLSDEQLQNYQRDGYVILGRVLDEPALTALRAEEARFRGDLGPKELTIFRSQLCNYSAIVRQFCLAGPHLPLVQQLVGPNLIHWFNQYVTKLPDANSGNSEFPWHQDNGYMAIEPATNLTVWFALDDVDEQNGCVWVLPGSHRLGLLDHKTRSPDSWHLSVPVDGDGIPARLKAGEAVAFSGLTLHRSKLNHTDRPRRAFFTEYADPAAQCYRTGATPRPVIDSPQAWLATGQLPWAPAQHKDY